MVQKKGSLMKMTHTGDRGKLAYDGEPGESLGKIRLTESFVDAV